MNWIPFYPGQHNVFFTHQLRGNPHPVPLPILREGIRLLHAGITKKYANFVLFFFSVFFVPVSICSAAELTVNVNGVEELLQENILAHLKIYLQRENPKLTVREIKRLHKKAPEEIEQALIPFGYYSVTTKSSLVEDKEKWHAEYTVIPGEPVKVNQINISVEGENSANKVFSSLEEIFPLKVGDVLDHTRYESGKKQLVTLAMAHGYVNPRLTEHTVYVHKKKLQADIKLALDTGPLFYFGETSSEQQVIKEDLLYQFLPYKKGDVYSLPALNRLHSDLYATEYFSQVLIEPQLEEAENLEIPVEISLIRGKPNRYSFGIGYRTDTKMNGTVGWSNRLLNSSGHKVSTSLLWAEEEGHFDALYTIPVLDPRYDIFAIGADWVDETWENTWSEVASAGLSLSHNEPKFQLGTNIKIHNEKYRIGNVSGNALLLMPGASGSIILSDNPVNTVNGLRLNLNVKGADKNIVSSTSFLQTVVNGKAIYTPFEKWRLIGRFSFGSTAMESIDELPPSLRFYAGGDQSVRGYKYRSLGPTEESGVVIGGQYLVELSGEVEFKITDMFSVAAFHDMGNAMDDIDADLKHGAGLGVRINLPFGQIRMDVASALSESGNPLRLHLTVGADL